MAAGLEQRPGAHVRAADAQHDDAIDLAGQSLGGGQDPAQLAALALAGVFVQQPLGQVDERRRPAGAFPSGTGSAASATAPGRRAPRSARPPAAARASRDRRAKARLGSITPEGSYEIGARRMDS